MCKFEKISKEELKESPSYIISTTILNRRDEFTIDDILEEICKKLNSKLGQLQIQNYALEKLFMFIDNGIVVEHGSYFSIKEKIR